MDKIFKDSFKSREHIQEKDILLPYLNSLTPKTTIAEFANSKDIDELAHTVCPLVFKFLIGYSLSLKIYALVGNIKMIW